MKVKELLDFLEPFGRSAPDKSIEVELAFDDGSRVNKSITHIQLCDKNIPSTIELVINSSVSL